MNSITLTLRTKLSAPLDGSSIVPDRFADLDGAGLAQLPVWSAAEPRAAARLGDVFRIEGERSDQVRIVGDCALVDGLGQRMQGGRLLIEGDAGAHSGRAMSGGVIVILGSTGGNLGGAFPGATKGMSGGEIVVQGSAGPEAGARLRRGLIYLGGQTGPRAGRGMIAGTLVLREPPEAEVGVFNKRGSIVLLTPPAAVANPFGPTYPYACTYRPPHLPLILTRLRAVHGAAVTDAQISGPYRRYSGDLTDVGKGEILAWTGA